MYQISIRQATIADLEIVADVLAEAAMWLERRNMRLWQPEHIAPTAINQDIQQGLYYLAVYEGAVAGVVKFQTEDLEFWPDIDQSSSAFLHRLAVRRQFSGGSVSTQIFQWAIAHSYTLGKQFLRLDCVADRLRLRAVYENFGFQHHSDRQVGAYFVARYEYVISKPQLT
jgi:GNAT superfamily N-acetyltransferase